MNAALSGFASQYGLAVQIDKTAPPAAQAQVLFSTMNPQLAAYNPIASNSNAERLGQTASVAAAAATLFFGTPIGLAAGGTAMVLDLRSIAFPGTQFRSCFAQPVQVGVHLCGQRGAVPPHTRIAYIWALRVPNTGSTSDHDWPCQLIAAPGTEDQRAGGSKRGGLEICPTGSQMDP